MKFIKRIFLPFLELMVDSEAPPSRNTFIRRYEQQLTKNLVLIEQNKALVNTVEDQQDTIAELTHHNNAWMEWYRQSTTDVPNFLEAPEGQLDPESAGEFQAVMDMFGADTPETRRFI